ncbi:serine/threonine-protein kinase [Streptomyces omiyaensis]|uniref:DUF4157 domain-containing protein n=1 Tax=Streptomyces omiyaensis TaxID=68247 RepID=A0ABW7BU81_9ACTN
MTSLKQSVRRFDLYAPPQIVSLREVADGVGAERPVSAREVLRRLDAVPSEVRLAEPVTTGTALGGRAEMVLRSNGTYTSTGHMRATGFPSFAFVVQPTVEGGGGRFRALAVHQGRVFGTDTPGDRQRNWSEDGRNEAVRQNWLTFARDARLTVRKEWEVSGVLGTLGDIATAVAQFVGAAAVTGSGGMAAALVIGSRLGEAAHEPWPFPGLPAGVTIASGVLLVFGPAAIVPALAAGVAVEALVDHRPLSTEEEAFAVKVFGPTLPPREQIILTNISGLDDRAFVVPGAGGSYLVNLGDHFDDPMAPRGKYRQRGQMLIHELTHVWQAKRWPATTYFCQGVTESTYEPGGDPGRPWSAYGIEQQATIVDRWYAADPGFLTGEFQKPHPNFSLKAAHPYDHYIHLHIRAGMT